MLRRAYLASVIFMAFLMCTTTLMLAEPTESPEPIYEYENHYERPLRFIINDDGSLSLDVFIEVYDEPQENENSEGLDIGYDIEWDEPLYYKGSTKEIWLTYDGYGIHIIINGPDAGLNTHTYIEIQARYVNADVEIHISTGIIPV